MYIISVRGAKQWQNDSEAMAKRLLRSREGYTKQTGGNNRPGVPRSPAAIPRFSRFVPVSAGFLHCFIIRTAYYIFTAFAIGNGGNGKLEINNSCPCVRIFDAQV